MNVSQRMVLQPTAKQNNTVSDSSEKKKLEERLKETETGGAALKEDLTEMQCKLDSSDAERENQAGRSQELEREVKSLRATLESSDSSALPPPLPPPTHTHLPFLTFLLVGIDSELMKEKQRSREELAEMEKLLNIAKREHSKAIVQLQQLTRQLTRDKERAAEAAEIGRARLERELASCRKKLQSVQVERNLLLVSSCYYHEQGDIWSIFFCIDHSEAGRVDISAEI